MSNTQPPDIKIDAANVVEGAGNVIHDAERDTRHGLSHLIDEAKETFITIPEEKIKEFLAWIAGKI
jgi:hypothetical protein